MREICILGDYPYETGLDFFGLIGFALFSFVIVSFLLWYYNNIPKSNFSENDFQKERKVSRLPKMILYLSIIIPIIFLLTDLLNFGNLITSFDILMLISLATLILYLNITPIIKTRINKEKLDRPVYNTLEGLLQSNSCGTNFLVAKKSTSVFTKIILFALIIVVLITPFSELL